MKKWLRFAALAGCACQLVNITALAAVNPYTGDESIWLMGLMVGALVISGVLIVAFAVVGKKKKR